MIGNLEGERWFQMWSESSYGTMFGPVRRSAMPFGN